MSRGRRGPAGGTARARGFPPVAGPDARVLVLGSMPGRPSLAAGAYYANPRNAFWRILGEVLGFEPDLPYARRLEALVSSGVALWDVLASCERPSSLDADIVEGSLVVNPFDAFLREHAGVRRVLCNGGKAFALFERHVVPVLRVPLPERRRLPSTSPAHAAVPYETKLAAWRDALADLVPPGGPARRGVR